MATTTPNFGWSVPTSTDLVKDGATAIETLGDSIDASLVDLKGGTTGQVLAKASGADMDFNWVAQDDSNAIQNALLTTTGDTIYASAASTPARLGIGTTGQVLTVAGGVPSWATATASTPVFSLVTSGTITSGTELSITGLSSYDQLQIAFTGANCGTSGSQLNVRFNSSTASTYYTLGGHLEIQNTGSTFTSCTVAPSISSSNNAFRTPRGYLSPGTQNSLVLDLKGCKSSTGFTTGTVTGFFESYVQVGEQFYQYVFGQATAATLSSVQFFWEDGYAFTGGNYRVYGA
jgi:hypothetical protein